MAETKIFARITPKSVKISEEYFYDAEFTKHEHIHPHRSPDKIPKGKLEITIPYDGEKYFTAEARKQIERQRPKVWRQAAAVARVGYLALTNYGNTTLKDILALEIENDTVALDLPLCHEKLP